MSIEKRERNLKIRSQIRCGKPISKVAKDYGLSYATVSSINYRMMHEEDLMYDDEMYFGEIHQACDILHSSCGMATKIINRLQQNGYGKQYKWTRLTRAELQKIHSFGERALEIVELAQKLYFESKANTTTKPQVNEAL